MAVRNNGLTWHVAAGTDLTDGAKGTGEIYKAIALNDGDIAANGAEAGGILTQLASTGQGAGITITGVEKYTAGAAVAANAKVTVTTSGYFITADSGDFIVGRNSQTAVASGAVGTGVFNFANPAYAVNSNAIV